MLPPPCELLCTVCTLMLKQGMDLQSWARTELWPSPFRAPLQPEGLMPPFRPAATGSPLTKLIQQTKSTEQQSRFGN